MRYRGRHDSQYNGSPRLHRMGCTPQSTANALRSTTGGKIDLTGDQMLALLPNSEEQYPLTPGWSLIDAHNAVAKINGAPTLYVRQTLWSGVEAAWAGGFMVILQGDSDVFPDGCSGTFDGLHCIDAHPDMKDDKQWTGDPICPDWGLKTRTTLRAYAEKFPGTLISWAQFAVPVPEENDMPAVPYTITASTPGKLVNIKAAAIYRDLLTGEYHPLPGPEKDFTAVIDVAGVGGYLLPASPAFAADDGNYDAEFTPLGGLPGPTPPTIDEAAIRADQKRRDQLAAGEHLIP